MTPTETIAILRQFNEWRRGEDEDIPQPAAHKITAAIDAAVEMIGRLEAAEKETASWKGLAKQFGNEADALRAKIEAMEKQEPVRWFYVTNGEWDCYSRERPPEDACDAGSLMALYALPGAQPAQSVPDVDALAQFIRETDGSHQLGAGVLAERIVAWLAAAPEAKP